MKISELIKQLQEVLNDGEDLEIYLTRNIDLTAAYQLSKLSVSPLIEEGNNDYIISEHDYCWLIGK